MTSLSGTFAAATLAVLALGAALAPEPARAGDEDDRTVTTTGRGEVRAEPDRAYLTLGVTTRNPKADVARAEVNRVVEALLKLTRELKIPDALVRATRVHVIPEYHWNDAKRQQQFTTYAVTRQVQVELRDLDLLGRLLERGMAAGANLVLEPVLDSSKRADLERQALALAVADARANADVLARAVGMSVGTARSVADDGAGRLPGPPVPMARAAMAMEATADAADSYQPGELVFTASANVTWDLVASTKR